MDEDQDELFQYRSDAYRAHIASDFAYSAADAAQPAWPFQAEAIDTIIPKIDKSAPTVLHLATGGGKTRVANDVVREWLRLKGAPIVWITKDWRLLAQAARDLSRRHKHIRIAREGGDGKNLHPIWPGGWADVVFSTIQTSQKRLHSSDWAWSRPSLVVWDECHWGETAGAAAILHWCGYMGTPVLGLTATPRVHGKYIVTYSKSFKELVDREVLANPLVDGPVATKVDWLPSFDAGEVATASLWELTTSLKRNERIVSHYVDNQHKYQRTIVFACNIEHANRLAALLIDRGIAAESVHSYQSEATTHKALHRFKEGSLQVLVNVEMLTHGIDVPNARTVFLCRPTTSDILFAQMIGRAARREPGIYGKKDFYIVEFTDNVLKHGELLRTYKQFFTGSAFAGTWVTNQQQELKSPAVHPLVVQQRRQSRAWCYRAP